MSLEEELLDRARKVIRRAREEAEIAEVFVRKGRELSVRVRQGAVERVEEAGNDGVGLRVFKDGRAGTSSTSDTTDAGLERLVADALQVAALSEHDPDAGPPAPHLLSRDHPDLDLYDPSLEAFEAADATDWALRAESAALGVDARLTNSDGAECSRAVGVSALVTSAGFEGASRGSFVSVSARPLAEDGGGKKRGASEWDARRHLEDMSRAEVVGQRAGEKTIAKLGAKKMPTSEVPVVFPPDTGRALLGALCGCLSGSSVYRRSTYLAEREGGQVANPRVTITDDPLVPRGPGSRPFDGEGLASRVNEVIKDGVLKLFLCDSYSARKLGRESTGSASRGMGARPGVGASNFRLLPGEHAPEDIIRGVERGLYVTSMMGFGFNPVTGDFSRGAEGFLIEDGALTTPVSEITISLGFDDLWRSIDAIGHDLDTRSATSTPTFRVSRMTVAGS